MKTEQGVACRGEQLGKEPCRGEQYVGTIGAAGQPSQPHYTEKGEVVGGGERCGQRKRESRWTAQSVNMQKQIYCLLTAPPGI